MKKDPEMLKHFRNPGKLPAMMNLEKVQRMKKHKMMKTKRRGTNTWHRHLLGNKVLVL